MDDKDLDTAARERVDAASYMARSVRELEYARAAAERTARAAVVAEGRKKWAERVYARARAGLVEVGLSHVTTGSIEMSGSIRRRRRLAGLTIRQLAELAGIGHVRLGEAEREETVLTSGELMRVEYVCKYHGRPNQVLDRLDKQTFILAQLVARMEAEAHEGDGIHEDSWESYQEARRFLAEAAADAPEVFK